MSLYHYDFATGPMADSGVSAIQCRFKAGTITFDQAVQRIIGHTNGSQVAVLSKKAVKHLQLLEVIRGDLQAERARVLGLDSADPA